VECHLKQSAPEPHPTHHPTHQFQVPAYEDHNMSSIYY
jgi:hypothetical protein